MPGHIPWQKIDLHLRAQRTIWIGTTRPNGRPHSIPVWFCWDGANLYFVTKRSTQKAQNLSHETWVVAHLGDGDDAIILEGPATVVTDPDEHDRIEA